MKHTQVMEAVEVCRVADLCPNIQGPPGCGKTRGLLEYAERIGFMAVILSLSKIYDPVDTRGIPCVVNGHTVWNPPDFIRRNGKPVMIFVDDYGNAPPTSQANLNTLFLDRELGGHPLPEGTFVVAAGNRMSDASAIHATPAALANRMVWMTMGVDLDDWCNWALPAGVPIEVVFFHRYTAGAYLYPMYNSDAVKGKCELCKKQELEPGELCAPCLRRCRAFPTPRTWEFVGKIMQQHPDPGIQFELIAGCVGVEMATEFRGSLDLYDAPSVDAILLGPNTCKVPKQPAVLYSLARALGRKATKDNLEVITAYLKRMPPEFGVLTMRDAKTRDINILTCRAAIQWMSKNNDVLM